MSKLENQCDGGGQPCVEFRKSFSTTFAKCPECGRVLVPTPTGKFRKHQVRNRTTASLDNTRDALWSAGAVIGGHPHFALGLTVRVREGARPVGWGDTEDWDKYWDDDDYGRSFPVTDVHISTTTPDSFSAGGWFWDPSDLVVTY